MTEPTVHTVHTARSAQRYALRDNDAAAARLERLSAMFAPTSRRLLRRAMARPGAALAIDLGCGPGFTTDLVHRTLAPRRTVGLDASPSYVQRARDRSSLEFGVHDVTSTPFPVGAPDLVFARFLLSHLPDPREALVSWTAALSPSGGTLVCEETEWLRGHHPAVETYVALQRDFIANAGGELFVGPTLVAAAEGLPVASDVVATLEPSGADAAAIFVLNLEAWRSDPYVAARLDPRELDALQAEIRALGESAAPIADWGMRQLVIRKEGRAVA